MPRTPPGWNTTLEHYAHYWGVALGKSNTKAKQHMREIRSDVTGVWGSSDDPLGSHTPVAQNAILKRLAKLAAGRIDDWESHVDPTLSPGENYQILLERGGELPADEKEEIRRAIAETVDEREQSRAAELLRSNADAIEVGDKQQLVDDIAAEYGQEFVDETLRELRESNERAAEVTLDRPEPTASTPFGTAPEGTTHTESLPASEVESAGPIAAIDTVGGDPTDPAAGVQSDPTPEPAPEPTAAADSNVSLGLLSGFVAAIIGFFQLGMADSQQRSTSDTQTTLNEY